MFTNKLEVDKHVESCLRKINNDLERNLRSLAFARLYYKVGEYEQALRYVQIYLNAKPTSAEGQNLHGKIHERLGRNSQALEAYRLSLDLDTKQNSLVLKICELMAQDQNLIDQTSARYYCEKAQSIDPRNPIISRLKERLVASSSKDPNDVTQLLLKELEAQPLDVNLRMRLLRHLMQNNRIREAYTHAFDIEQKSIDVFLNSLQWYETVSEVLGAYRSTSYAITWEFWMMYVSVYDKLASLGLNERTKAVEYVPLVLGFDQALQLVSDKLGTCPQKQLVQEFWRHYTGQLCWHLTTLLFKQARKEIIKYRETNPISIPLLFASYNFKPVDLKSLWIEHATAGCRQQMQRWNREAAFRCTQAGNMLQNLAHERKATILERGTQGVTGIWREKTFKFLFVRREHQNKVSTSYFVLTNHLLDIQIRLPEADDLLSYTQSAQLVHPDSLHHHIWLGLHVNLVDFDCAVFSGLQYTVKTLSNCAAETLNILDVQAFIYASVICARASIEDLKHNNIYYNADRPAVLPVACVDLLGTANQDKWLRCAYKMFTNQHNSEFSDIRMTLIRGIEVVRCVGNHGLDVKLLVQLARLFAQRATKVKRQSEVEANDARAEMYWKAAMHLLEKYKRNEAVSHPNNRLFDIKGKDFTQDEIQQAINDGKLFLGLQAMKKKDLEKAIGLLKNIKDPYASFHQAQIYKMMADKETNLKQENVTSEMRSQNIILLTKARDCLYLTLDRLSAPGSDPKHPLNEVLGTEIEKIERLLSRIDPDNNRNECDGMSDDNVSSIESENYNYTRLDTSHLQSTPFRMDHSRGGREARPSPERLDAQIRQLAASKDMALNRVLEQNKFMIETQKTLADELKSFRETVTDLTSTINDLKSLKIVVEDVKEIKKTVDELENLRNITDMVHELKREIADLKKDQQQAGTSGKSKPQQLSEEDLYVLDDEYAAEFANAHSVPALSSTLYPNSAARMNNVQNPISFPTSPMYGYPMFPYGAMGLPQPAAMPPAANPVEASDYRAMNLLQHFTLPPAFQQPPAAALPPSNFMQQQYQPTSFAPQSMNMFMPPITTTISFGSISTAQATTITTSISATSSTVASSRSAPINVVITSSDPLPKTTAVVQPQLSVSIPPQHIKGSKVHNYQITLPSSMPSASAPSVLSKAPLVVGTQGILSNVSPPVYSAISEHQPQPSPPAKNSALGIQIERSLNTSFNKSTDADGEHSADEEQPQPEYDPYPDFKPIVPLPDEVPVHTGEEDEVVLFNERAKLYRHVNKEWKERGVGDLKILQHRDTGKVRLLMRRDQVHKICANHYLTPDMQLEARPSKPEVYTWCCLDFSDGESEASTLCARFKTADIAKKFYDTFEKSKHLGAASPSSPAKSISVSTAAPDVSTTSATTTTANLGGFKFTSTPSFKPKTDEQPEATSFVKPIVAEVAKSVASPFAAFSFSSITVTSSTTPIKPFASFSFTSKEGEASGSPVVSNLVASQTTPIASAKLATSALTPKTPTEKEDDGDDFVPTAEFKPVVPLPELIEVKTGEENAQVLFESRAKLYRFDSQNNEWKDRGIGQMKILKEEKIVRLVMRREQVHKVCCNHQLVKSIKFTVNAKSPNSISWYAQDYSEGVVTSEIFMIRFKTTELATNFAAVIKTVQDEMDENNCIGSSSKSTNSPHKKLDNKIKPSEGFGDAFKPKLGDWECKNCLIMNQPKVSKCIACETPKNEAVAKAAATETKFCFGVNKTQAGSGFSFGASITTTITTSAAAPTSTTGFGDAFKPKVGSWECKECYTRNDAAATKCISCEVSRDGEPPKTDNESSKLKGVDLSTGGLSFSFGAQPAKTNAPALGSSSTSSTTPVQGFGDKFKPKAGSWECKSCYTRNESGDYCLSCEAPKDSTIAPKSTPAKSEPKGIDLSTGGVTFSFGMPSTTTVTTAKTAALQPATTGSSTLFKTTATKDTGFSFSLKQDKNETKDTVEEETVFGSPHKVGFEFTPRSPRRQSSGQQNDDEPDNSYYEEEEANVYFKPVIPLPDKITVTTGEEDEDVLYCHRAKLFKHTAGEWKERGIGDLKILYQKQDLKLRVLMRREQVHKICLNHKLTKDIKYSKKDDKTWLFNAPDYSDGEIEHCSFCLRFKTPEVAEEFMKAVNDALTRIDNGSGNTTIEESDSDVEFVSETTVTKEEIQEAIKLMLPPKYMAYRQLTDCTCEQCKKDDLLAKNPVATPSKSSFFSCGTPTASIFGTPNTRMASSEFSFGGSGFSGVAGTTIFGTGKPTTPSWNPPTTPNAPEKKQETLKDLLVMPAVFGNLAASQNKSIFGGVATSTEAKQLANVTAPVFANTSVPAAPKPTIFGTGANTVPSVFGSFATPPQSGNIFGASSMNSSFSGGSLFGGTATPTPANVFNTSGNIFGGTAKTSTPDSASGDQIKTEEKKEPETRAFSFANYAKDKIAESGFGGGETVLGSNSSVSFASLAANAENTLFGKPTGANSNENVFAKLGAGAPVFGAPKTLKPNANTSQDDVEEGGDEGAAGEAEHDPHFEPIIPLPDEIEVKTGEEDEQVMFCERGKLYRFVNKEWKERGVGNIKILHHPVNKTYRMIMRREQVHKVVLNQRITADLEVIAFTLSPNAWMWVGMNYTEEGHELEKLAIRFKNDTLSHHFHTAVGKAITGAKKLALASQQQEGIVESVSEDEDDDDEYDDDDEDRTVIYSCECGLFERKETGEWMPVVAPGLVEVVYDREIEGARIVVTNDAGITVSNTLIAVNTNMERHPNDEGDELHWRAVEYSEDRYEWRMLQLKFDSPEDVDAFNLAYVEGKGYAEQSNIIDTIEEVYETYD